MVVYNLACTNSHSFEGWFASPEVFDEQAQALSVSCPVCGSNGVVKQPSAPNIGRCSSSQSGEKRENDGPRNLARFPEEALRELRAKVLDYMLKNTEDVGKKFPDEARRIHYREAPERAIRGQATVEQAKELKEEGIDVMALPMAPVPPGQLH
ncbi:MAG: DUF1178 family protein [Betaproteobacteria bacterium]|nr:DUF1178 family protein [Betaproteobacteria bacterium]